MLFSCLGKPIIKTAIVIISGLPFAAFANSFNAQEWTPFINLGLGTVITTDAGASQDFPSPIPGIFESYNYSTNRHTQTRQAFDAFVGAEWQGFNSWAIQAGVDYNEISNLGVNGTYTQGLDVQSQSIYSYNYQVSSQQLLLQSKLLYMSLGRFHPYVLAGLGAAFNNAENYTTNVPPTQTYTREYLNNSNTSFSYALGTGLDFDITSHVRIGLGYRFADLGKVSLGSASINNYPVTGTLSQSHLYTNELLASFTALF